MADLAFHLQLVNNLETAVLLLDQDLNVQYLNASAEALMQVSGRRCIGEHIEHVFIDGKDQTGFIKSLTEGNPYTKREAELVLPVKQKIIVDYSVLAADIDMNADANDVAISGYDTVAYFTKSKPVKGNAKYSATYKNTIYQFSSAKNRDLFRANPSKYAPQFGGFCAMGVALEKKLAVDPAAWRIVDNKLYLNLNPAVQKKWLSDTSGYIHTAQHNWPTIKLQTAAQLNAE